MFVVGLFFVAKQAAEGVEYLQEAFNNLNNKNSIMGSLRLQTEEGCSDTNRTHTVLVPVRL